jgi:trehalose utilization protein
MAKINVTIWNEFVHEVEHEPVRKVYPDGIHNAVAKGISGLGDFNIRTATLAEKEHGLTDDVLKTTDVMIWWGHMAHDKVDDAIVEKVRLQVLSGMGLIVLHSGHYSKIFQRLMGTFCSLKWREADEKERLWNLEPSHPIMQDIPDYFELAQEEMYGERFDIPTPEKLLMVSWFQGGEVFRSLCTWQRGHGSVVYFRPGHETFPTYFNEHVLKIIANSCTWASRKVNLDVTDAPNSRELEPVPTPTKTPVGQASRAAKEH